MLRCCRPLPQALAGKDVHRSECFRRSEYLLYFIYVVLMRVGGLSPVVDGTGWCLTLLPSS